MTAWLTATVTKPTPAPGVLPSEVPPPTIHVVVTKLRGLQLAVDSSIDDAEDAARELLRVCAQAREGSDPAVNRMFYYDFELVDGVARVFEGTKPEVGARRRMLSSNSSLGMSTIVRWCHAWCDGEEPKRIEVTRVRGAVEVHDPFA